MLDLTWPLALLLLPVPLIARRFLVARAREITHFPLPDRLANALSGLNARERHGDRGKLALTWAIWFALVLAVAQPRLVFQAEALPMTGHELVLAIDLSKSMQQRDFVLDGVASDRLSAVKRVAGDFLRARQGDRIGLVVFADEAFVAAPLSFDTANVAYQLDRASIGLAGRATAIGDALGLALNKLRSSAAASRAVILLSDGVNNAGTVDPLSAAALAGKLGVRIHTIVIGAEDRVQVTADGRKTIAPKVVLDTEVLRKIAASTAGQFFRVRTMEELRAVYDRIDQLEAAEALAPPFTPSRPLSYFCLIAALISVGILFVRQHFGWAAQ